MAALLEVYIYVCIYVYVCMLALKCARMSAHLLFEAPKNDCSVAQVACI